MLGIPLPLYNWRATSEGPSPVDYMSNEPFHQPALPLPRWCAADRMNTHAQECEALIHPSANR